MELTRAAHGCAVEGCTRRHRFQGLCLMHYMRRKRQEDLERVARSTFGLNANDEPPLWSSAPPVLTKADLKALVRQRDGYRCRLCRLTAAANYELYGTNLEVHRIIPGSAYMMKGCVSLCLPCHQLQPSNLKQLSERLGIDIPTLEALRAAPPDIPLLDHGRMPFTPSRRTEARARRAAISQSLRETS